LGYRRLIYINSVCVLPNETRKLVTAMGDAPRAVSILLTCTDATAEARLGSRELGRGLRRHLSSSADMTAILADSIDDSTHRVPTDDRTVAQIAADVVACSGWLS
jgi:hypothetical protein